MLDMQNVTKTFGGFTALSDLSMHVPKGAVYGLVGPNGAGKTTTLRGIVALFQKMGLDILLAAPTGRAAKRMSELTGMEAQTIHRMLGMSWNEATQEVTFLKGESEPLEADAVIVDEMCMVDVSMFAALLRALKPGTRLVLVGDADQLPSVGAGNVLGDILESGVVPACRLTDIFRQGETSRIVVNAHRINHGEMPLLNEKGTDFFFERKQAFYDAASTIVALVTQRLPKFLKYAPADYAEQAVRNIQVLAPAKKGECGVIALNQMLQAKQE